MATGPGPNNDPRAAELPPPSITGRRRGLSQLKLSKGPALTDLHTRVNIADGAFAEQRNLPFQIDPVIAANRAATRRHSSRVERNSEPLRASATSGTPAGTLASG